MLQPRPIIWQVPCKVRRFGACTSDNDAFGPLRDQLGHRRVNIRGVEESRCDIGAIEFPGKHDRPHDEEDEHHDQDLVAAVQASQ